MSEKRENPKRIAFYFALSQVGFEMAAPIAIGYMLDQWLKVFPWGTVMGAGIGLAGGLTHLIVMSKHEPVDEAAEPKNE